ncbi:hypothetical protein [Streptomyces sp. NPDC014733]|uniref:hypothetical protein n=1 Tax=Streptomyces sp. NPDC014733 TaxID=3364885 RepID=UPI0037004F02
MELVEGAARTAPVEEDGGGGPGFTPAEAARAALRAGVRLPAERHAEVAAVAHHLHTVLGPLRELDLGETPPADHTTEREAADAPR